MLKRDSRGGLRSRPYPAGDMAREPTPTSDRIGPPLHLSPIAPSIPSASLSCSYSSSSFLLKPDNPSLFVSSHSFSTLSSSSTHNHHSHHPHPLHIQHSLLSSPSSSSSSSSPSPILPCHIPTMAVSTLSPACSFSPSTKHSRPPLDCPSHSSSVLSSSIHTVCYASSRGRQLARQSRSSLNRILDTVLDTATIALSESHAKHNQLSSIDKGSSSSFSSSFGSSSFPTPLTPTNNSIPAPAREPRPAMLSRQLSSKTKFFVCEDDSDSDSESDCEDNHVVPVYPVIRGIEHDLNLFATTPEQKPYSPHQQAMMLAAGSPGMGRRQSLLSDLFMAEKLSAAQKPAATTAADGTATKKSGLFMCYHGDLNSDRESSLHKSPIVQQSFYRSALSAKQQAQQQQAQPSVQSNRRPSMDRHYTQQPQQQQQQPQDDSLSKSASLRHGEAPKILLRRTKRSMFNKLDELAVDNIVVVDQETKSITAVPEPTAITTVTNTISTATANSSSSSSCNSVASSSSSTLNHCISAPVKTTTTTSSSSHSQPALLSSRASEPISSLHNNNSNNNNNNKSAKSSRSKRHYYPQHQQHHQQQRKHHPTSVNHHHHHHNNASRRGSPTAVTTTIAFATPSATSSKCRASISCSSSTATASIAAAKAVAASAAAAVAATASSSSSSSSTSSSTSSSSSASSRATGVEMTFPGWSRIQNLKTQAYSLCEQLNTSIQRAMSTVPTS